MACWPWPFLYYIVCKSLKKLTLVFISNSVTNPITGIKSESGNRWSIHAIALTMYTSKFKPLTLKCKVKTIFPYNNPTSNKQLKRKTILSFRPKLIMYIYWLILKSNKTVFMYKVKHIGIKKPFKIKLNRFIFRSWFDSIWIILNGVMHQAQPIIAFSLHQKRSKWIWLI